MSFVTQMTSKNLEMLLESHFGMKRGGGVICPLLIYGVLIIIFVVTFGRGFKMVK